MKINLIENKRLSYTAANSLPVKVMRDKELLDAEGKIKPRHIQLNITNKCNLNCSFCSCADRSKPAEMTLKQAAHIVIQYASLGCRAVTVTGGGEPTMHPQINEIIELFYKVGIKVGLVTNGILLNKITPKTLQMIEWIRISFDDSRDFSKILIPLNKIQKEKGKEKPDLSFSYVISRKVNYVNLNLIISWANKHNFSHIRVVSDLLDIDFVPDMDSIKSAVINELGVDDSLVVYQGRKEFTRGAERCLISLLKPVIDVDGEIYPCCGVQYAIKDTKNKYLCSMSMGNSERDIEKIYYYQDNFNGGDCDKCYYEAYNKVLDNLTCRIEHEEFE
jgi:MoaA/NifB/PqqE/SkfB family radical SAM enzyme